jgi:mannose-6-phosphate isomerase
VTQRGSHPVMRLDGSLRSYAWGSHVTIAALRGRRHPTQRPEAELWFGAHPSGPSELMFDGGSWPLDAVIADAPEASLGRPMTARFGPQLPFLLKLLAIERPLSLQAHPSAEQAATGFRDEDARGVPIDAPERTYRDPWPKPELLCALSDLDALAGFRDPVATRALLEDLDVPELGWLVEDLGMRGAEALADAVARLLRWPAGERLGLVDSVRERAEVVARADGRHAAVARWLVVLGNDYPADPGVAVAALLNLIRLRPGDAIHLPAGNLHAYLRGTAVEVMAASDNVLRGGLTVKHVDVDGLLGVLDTDPLTRPRVPPVPIPGGQSYPTPAEHFALARLVPGEHGLELDRRGPEILLTVGGAASVVADGLTVELTSGQAAFVPADARTVSVRGEGPVFRATVGDFRPV